MSERDKIHYAVRTALESDGWLITHDPLRITTGGTVFKMDLGAERMLAAEKGGERIAVEVKSFLQPSIVYAFYEAFGQYILYRDAIRDEGIRREVYLAVSDIAYYRIVEIPFLEERLKEYDIKVIVVNLEKEIIERWIK